MAKLARKRRGDFGEALCAVFLSRRGWEIKAEKWRHGRSGEVDIIASPRESSLVFLEVKTRSKVIDWNEHVVSAFESVDWRKQRRIIGLARTYCSDSGIWWSEIRFDVIFVSLEAFENSSLLAGELDRESISSSTSFDEEGEDTGPDLQNVSERPVRFLTNTSDMGVLKGSLLHVERAFEV